MSHLSLTKFPSIMIFLVVAVIAAFNVLLWQNPYRISDTSSSGSQNLWQAGAWVDSVRVTSSGSEELVLVSRSDEKSRAVFYNDGDSGLTIGSFTDQPIPVEEVVARRGTDPEDDFTAYLLSRGIAYTLVDLDSRAYSSYDSLADHFSHPLTSSWHKNLQLISADYFFQLKSSSRVAIEAALPESVAGLLVALILGDRTGIDADTMTTLSDLGVIHVFVVSGFHFSLLAGLLAPLLEKLSGVFVRLHSSLVNHTNAIHLLSIVAILYVYLQFLGAGSYAPARAFLAILVALFVKKWGSFLPSYIKVLLVLILSGLIMPAAIYSAGFQMSFAAWAAIVIFTGRSRKDQGQDDALGLALAAEFRSAIMGTLLVLPLALVLFGEVQLAALIFAPLFGYIFNYLQKFLWGIFISIKFLPEFALEKIYSVFSVVDSGLLWLKSLSLPENSQFGLESGTNLASVLLLIYGSYLIYKFNHLYVFRSDKNVLAEYSL